MTHRTAFDPKAIERVVGGCRALATAMRTDAEARGLFDGHNRRIITGWADQLDGLADSLTAALATDDVRSLGWLLRLTRRLAAPIAVLAVIGTGAGESAGERFLEGLWPQSDAVTECAADLTMLTDAAQGAAIGSVRSLTQDLTAAVSHLGRLRGADGLGVMGYLNSPASLWGSLEIGQLGDKHAAVAELHSVSQLVSGAQWRLREDAGPRGERIVLTVVTDLGKELIRALLDD